MKMLLTLVSAFLLGVSAQATDFNAFGTTASSTLSFINAQTGAESGGLVLGMYTRSGAVYSPDGKFAYIVQTPQFSGNVNTIVAFNLQTKQVAGQVTLPVTGIYQTALSPDGTKLYVLANRNSAQGLYQVDLTTYTGMKVANAQNYGAIAVSLDGSTLFVSTGTQILFISTANFQTIASYVVPGSGLIQESPDGKRLYINTTYLSNLVVTVFDLQSKKIIGNFPAEPDVKVVVSPDSSTIYAVTPISGSGNLEAEQVSAATLSVVNTAPIGVTSELSDVTLAISPDGKTLAVPLQNPGVAAPVVVLFSLPALTTKRTVPVGLVCGASFLPNGILGVTNCGADSMAIVDLKTKTQRQYDAGPGSIYTLPGRSGKAVYISSSYGVWAIATQTGQVLGKVDFPTPLYQGAAPLALSADGGTVFAGYTAGIAEISTATNQLAGYVSGLSTGFAVQDIATSADGKYLFASGTGPGGAHDYHLLLLDQKTGILVQDYPAPYLEFVLLPSHDSSVVYMAGSYYPEEDYSTVFTVATGTFTPGPPFGGVGPNLALSPNDKTLYVSGLSPSSITAYDTATFTSTVIPSPISPGVFALTPDGADLVVSSEALVAVIPVVNPSAYYLIPVANGGLAGISVQYAPQGRTSGPFMAQENIASAEY